MHLPLAAGVVLVAFFLVAAPSARAAIAYAPPAEVTADCDASSNLTPPYLQMVMDANGDELAAWECNAVGGGKITQEARLPAGGSWTTPVTLSTTSGMAPAIGIDGSGNGLVVWVQGSCSCSLNAAVIAPDGSVTSQTTLSNSFAPIVGPSVAVNASGDAVVAWPDLNSDKTGVAPTAAVGSLSTGFATPAQLDGYGTGLDGITAAIDPAGDTAVAWCATHGSCSSAISQSGGAFSPAAAFPSDGGTNDNAPMISMDPNGTVTFAWEKVGSREGGWAIFAAQEPLTGGFGSAQQISPSSSQIYQPMMASDTNGDAVVAWVDEGVSGLPVEATTLQAGASSFQPWFQVGNDGIAGSFISAIVDATGTATVSWTDQTYPCGCPPYPPSYSASFPTATSTTAGPVVSLGGSGLVSVSRSRPIVVTQLPLGATVPDTAGAADSIGAIWASPKKSRKDLFASTGRQLRYQPDAQIKLDTDKSYLGLGVFNTTAALQTRSTNDPRGHTATFDLKLVNAVLRSDTIALKGCTSSPGFTVRYTRGSTDVTKQVTAGSYKTSKLAPAASQALKLTITASSTASVGTTKTCQVTTSSVTQPKRKDLVEAKVKVGSG